MGSGRLWEVTRIKSEMLSYEMNFFCKFSFTCLFFRLAFKNRSISIFWELGLSAVVRPSLYILIYAPAQFREPSRFDKFCMHEELILFLIPTFLQATLLATNNIGFVVIALIISKNRLNIHPFFSISSVRFRSCLSTNQKAPRFFSTNHLSPDFLFLLT